MPPRKKRREQWRMTSKGTWTLSIGTRGQRITLFQNRPDGSFYRSAFIPGVGRDRQSLHTSDKAEAERLGKQLYAALISQTSPSLSLSVLRLGELCDAFVVESATFLDNSEHTKADTLTRLRVIRAGFGELRDVRSLTENDVRNYEAKRKAGGIAYGDGRVTSSVRQRSVQADIKLLKQVLNWACTRISPKGQRWLDQNPIRHVRVAAERDPKRPIANRERFVATMGAMRTLATKYNLKQTMRIQLRYAVAPNAVRCHGFARSLRCGCWKQQVDTEVQ